MWLMVRGYPTQEIAESTGYTRYSLRRIAKRYNAEGAEGMRNRRSTTAHGRSPVLSPALQEELRAVLWEEAARDEHWNGSDVAAWMAEKLGRPVSYHLGRNYLVLLMMECPNHVRANVELPKRSVHWTYKPREECSPAQIAAWDKLWDMLLEPVGRKPAT